MGQWSRAEIESAFESHKQVVVEIGTSWDWSRFADQFTADATYVEHTYGTLADATLSHPGISPDRLSFTVALHTARD